MPQNKFEKHLTKVEGLATKMLSHAGQGSFSDQEFSADVAGFLSIAYAAAFEECIKDIFIEFARNEHKVLHSVISISFDRIDSKIRINDHIKDKYLKQLGSDYRDRFSSQLEAEEKKYNKDKKASIKTSYENIINWRHEFAHKLESNTTISEVQSAYDAAKKVIMILNNCLHNNN